MRQLSEGGGSQWESLPIYCAAFDTSEGVGTDRKEALEESYY